MGEKNSQAEQQKHDFERKMISIRTKEALNILKENGIKLGGTYKFDDKDRFKAKKTLHERKEENINNKRAKAFLIYAYPTLPKHNGKIIYRRVSEILNQNGFTTSKGFLFGDTQTKRLVDEIEREVTI